MIPLIYVNEREMRVLICNLQRERSKVEQLGRRTFPFSSNGLLRISFDGQWEPFLGETLGYNYMHQRHYLELCPLLERIRSALAKSEHSKDLSGGRFFLGEQGVFRRGNEGELTLVFRWKVMPCEPSARSIEKGKLNNLGSKFELDCLQRCCQLFETR